VGSIEISRAVDVSGLDQKTDDSKFKHSV